MTLDLNMCTCLYFALFFALIYPVHQGVTLLYLGSSRGPNIWALCFQCVCAVQFLDENFGRSENKYVAAE